MSGEVQEVGIISAIKFDKSDDHLATADQGGRVVLLWFYLSIQMLKINGSRKAMARIDSSSSRHPMFRYKTEFQSHEPEFNYLKSLEIVETCIEIKITQIKSALWINSILESIDSGLLACHHK